MKWIIRIIRRLYSIMELWWLNPSFKFKAFAPVPMVLEFNTSTDAEVLTIPTQDIGTFNATINWGDSSSTSVISTFNDVNLTHTYATAGTYVVTITGTFPNIYFYTSSAASRLTKVLSLGDTGLQTLRSAFASCVNMVSANISTIPPIADISFLFYKCASLATPDVSGWDVSSALNIGGVFADCSGLTTAPDVSGWDVSSATDIRSIFSGCSGLTTAPDVSGWDTSSATRIGRVFYYCSGLTTAPDVSGWDTSSSEFMDYIFAGCSGLTTTPDVSGWNTSSVLNISGIFASCYGLTTTPDVSGWDTSLVESTSSMFSGCSGLTTAPDVSGWDTSSVLNIELMFYNCSGLTTAPDVSGWDTSSSEAFNRVFNNCTSMIGLNPSTLNLSSVVKSNGLDYMFTGVTIDTVDYDATLIAWDAQNIISGITMDFGLSKYTSGGAAEAARNNLINSNTWTILDGGIA